MKRLLAYLGIITFLSSAAVAQLREQDGQVGKLEGYRLKLKSGAFSDRAEAVRFVSTLRLEDRPEGLNHELVELYRIEVARDAKRMESVDKPGRFEDIVPKEVQYTNTEEFHEYLAELARLIAQTKDPEMLPFLIRTMLSTEVLIPYGDMVIDPVIREMEDSSNEVRREVAFVTLRQFYAYRGESYTPSPDAKARIMAAVIKMAENDKDGPNRSGAVEFLGDVGDRKILPLLVKIAASDPFHFSAEAVRGIDEGVSPGTRIVRYPVRNAAKIAIEKIKVRERAPDQHLKVGHQVLSDIRTVKVLRMWTHYK